MNLRCSRFVKLFCCHTTFIVYVSQWLYLQRSRTSWSPGWSSEDWGLVLTGQEWICWTHLAWLSPRSKSAQLVSLPRPVSLSPKRVTPPPHSFSPIHFTHTRRRALALWPPRGPAPAVVGEKILLLCYQCGHMQKLKGAQIFPCVDEKVAIAVFTEKRCF